MTREIYDLIGIGFGPANLALAVALDNRGMAPAARFFEQRASFAWQPDMLLRGSDIQHNPLRDLITPVNPRSPYGFVSYLHQSGRFFEYLNLGAAFPLRREFAAYVEWVAAHFARRVSYDARVDSIDIVRHPGHGNLVEVTVADGTRHLAHNVVVGPGRSWNIPAPFERLIGERVFHLMEYLPRLAKISDPERIAVIGGSQSAVEIMLDLDSRFPRARIEGVTRKFGYRLKDTSPFTGEVFFPEFTDYYYSASSASRSALAAELRGTNYSSADRDVLEQLYLRRYESSLEGFPDHLVVHRSTAVTRASAVEGGVELQLRDLHDHSVKTRTYDAVVLATGFLDFGTGGQREPTHPLLERLRPHYAFDPEEGFGVSRDYALIGGRDLPGIYLNGLCENTHGFGDAGSFSLLSLRADEIAHSLGGRLGRGEAVPIRPRRTPAHVADAAALCRAPQDVSSSP